MKQNKLSLLESQLDAIDKNETAALRLGSCRSDDNAERLAVLSEIDIALSDYDALIERNHRILNLEAANARDISSLQNWADGNACLARQETAYLAHQEDLLSVAPPKDYSVSRFEAWVEDALVRSSRLLGKPLSDRLSRDPRVHIFSGPAITIAARALIASVSLALLLTPSIICVSSSSVTIRILVIVSATIVLIAALSTVARARTVDMFVVGATYMTVLTVFFSSTSSTSPSSL